MKTLFPQRLNAVMARKGLIQADIIRDLGINKSTISTWCRGVSRPRADTLLALAKYLSVSPSYLMGWEDE